MSLLFGAIALGSSGIIAYKDIQGKKIAFRKEKREFIFKFKQFIQSINKYNKLNQTYEVLEYIPKNYGCDVIVSIPIGYDIKGLIEKISALELIYNANIIIEPSSSKNSAYMRVHYIDRTINIKDDIKFKWYKCMNNIEKARNNVYETFNIEKIKEIKDFNKNNCGYELNIKIPNGLDYHLIYNNLQAIEQSLKGLIYGNYDKDLNKFILKLITIPMDNNCKFKLCKPKHPYELFGGYAYDYTPIFADMRYLVHGSVSGRTGMGKSVEIQIMLTNHIYWFSSKVFNLYLAQLSSKSDVGIFKDVNQCKYCATDIEKVYKMFCYLKKEMDRRNKLFEECSERTDKVVLNIYKYNSLNPKNILPEIIIYSDEFMCYQPTDLDNEDSIALKKKCLSILLSIFTEGRNVGMHILYALQRPDCASLLPLMKAQTGLRICFRQENEASSKTVLDGVESLVKLCNLKEREAFVISNERYLMKTLYLNEDDIPEILKHRIDKSHKNYINLDEELDEKQNDNAKGQQSNNDSSHVKSQKNRNKKYWEKKKQNNVHKLPGCFVRSDK